jgi:PAT family beta-lactamase induction signal transducer AmpG
LEQYGIIYGLAGVVCLLVGGIVGGIYIAKKGLSRSLWPMALALTVPCIGYVYLSAFHPTNLYLIAVIIGIEQLGYGFGFTAYMLYMMHFADGEFKTSHYAICTAFMALSMMLPGFVAGYIQEALGYTLFFWFVMVCCSATLVVTYLVRKQLCKEEQ